MRLVGLFLVAATWVSSAQAAPRVCSADAKAAGGEVVSVVFHVDGGKVTESFAIWSPPSEKADTFPILHLIYGLGADALDSVEALRVNGFVEVTPPPKSSTAQVFVKLDDGRDWWRPWELFAAQMAQLHRPGAPPVPKRNGEPVGFWGSVPIAFKADDRDALNPDLLEKLPSAKRLHVRIEGDAGELLGEKTYEIGRIAGRDALVRDAWGRASEAAKTPRTCKEGAR